MTAGTRVEFSDAGSRGRPWPGSPGWPDTSTPLVGMQFLHQRAMGAADLVLVSPRRKAKHLVGFLLGHRAGVAPRGLPGVRITLCCFTPAGKPAVEISIQQPLIRPGRTAGTGSRAAPAPPRRGCPVRAPRTALPAPARSARRCRGRGSSPASQSARATWRRASSGRAAEAGHAKPWIPSSHAPNPPSGIAMSMRPRNSEERGRAKRRDAARAAHVLGRNAGFIFK